jgi:hypothetical protein
LAFCVDLNNLSPKFQKDFKTSIRAAGKSDMNRYPYRLFRTAGLSSIEVWSCFKETRCADRFGGLSEAAFGYLPFY